MFKESKQWYNMERTQKQQRREELIENRKREIISLINNYDLKEISVTQVMYVLKLTNRDNAKAILDGICLFYPNILVKIKTKYRVVKYLDDSLLESSKNATEMA